LVAAAVITSVMSEMAGVARTATDFHLTMDDHLSLGAALRLDAIPSAESRIDLIILARS
jgi:hypothetical protein